MHLLGEDEGSGDKSVSYASSENWPADSEWPYLKT